MEKVFSLNSAEEFELWLESLRVYYQQSTGGAASDHSLPSEHNFRGELRSALEVIGDLVERCPTLLAEMINSDHPEKLSFRTEKELTRFIREHDQLKAKLQGLLDFWEYLRRCRVLGLSVARHHKVSRPEFRAFGLLMNDQIEAFLAGESWGSMARKHSDYTFHHIIHRDILSSVEIQGTREELERVFHHFFAVLTAVQYAQTQIQSSFKYQKLRILLSYCYHGYQQFLTTLDQANQYLRYTQPDLAEAVEAIRFGLKLEVRRIFDQELGEVTSEQKLHEIYSNIESGLGLLRHASRQSFTSLVRELNPQFNELDLFLELRNQQSASVQLKEDLKELYDLARDPKTQHSESDFAHLLKSLTRFRRGSMRVLFFKDWHPFEQFHRELEASESRERAFILHRFEVYLSTLIGEVGKRAILHRDGSMAQGIG